MSIAAVLSVVGVIFGLLGLIGGAVAYLAAMRQRTTIAVLETDNKARGERMETLERAEAECKVRLAAAEVKVQVLTDTVTQAHAVAELQAKVDRVIDVATALDAKVEGHFSEVLARLAGAGAA
jgi:Tfp pilus assembly protein PilN